MGTLAGYRIGSTYQQLLKISSATLGSGSSAKAIEDGTGVDSALSISTTNVGIGTLTPEQKLSIEDGQMIFQHSSLNQFESGRIRFSERADGSYQGAYIHYDGDNTTGNMLHLGVHANNDSNTAGDQNAISIARATGNVGIGTIVPDSEIDGTILHIEGGSDSSVINFTGGGGADGNYIGQIQFSDPGNTDERLAAIASAVRGSSSVPGGSLEFYTQPDAGSLTRAMYIDENGLVGIGTAGTTSKLHISASNASQLHLTRSGSSANCNIRFTNSEGSMYAGMDYTDTLLFGIGTGTDQSSTAKFVVEATGNVGIGTTAPDKELHILTTDTTGTGGGIRVERSGNSHIMLTAGSSSYGAGLISNSHKMYFTTNNDHADPQMIILTNGNVGIGTASPGATLHVQAASGSHGYVFFDSDAGEDNADKWSWHVAEAGGMYWGTYTGGSWDNILRLSTAGALHGEGGITVAPTEVDYAEYFETSDGKAIAKGTTVVLIDGKIRPAVDGESPFGVIRPNDSSAVIAGLDAEAWQGKYLRDEFGSNIYEDYNYVNDYGTDKTGSRKKVNPDFDESLEHTPRSDRDEWQVVGLLGQVQVLKGQPIPSSWMKMKSVSDTLDLYYVFPVGNEENKIALLTTAIQELSNKVTALENA